MNQYQTYQTPKTTYQTTNDSFAEVFAGEYDLNLKDAPKAVTDIGANEGAFTAWALERWPGCKVTAYEPMPFNAEVFWNNHRGNPGVRLFQVAVACPPNNDPIRIFLGRHNSGECSAHDLGEQRCGEFIDVAFEIPQNVSCGEFVKVDTEGCEVEIITGLNLAHTKALVCEYHREYDQKAIQKIMQDRGFGQISHKRRCQDRGVLKFARPGVVADGPPLGVKPVQRTTELTLPGNMMLTGNHPDGRLISLPVDSIANPHYLPELKGRKLFIGIPVYSQMMTSFVRCLMELQAHKPCPIEVHIGAGDGVGRTRNVLTEAFLASDCTEMLLMDSDLIFSPEHVVMLMKANQPVVGGFYPKKQEGNLEWVVNALPGNPPMRPDGLQPLRYVGTGFLLIQRSVFEKMIAAYPEISYREDYGKRGIGHDFWSMGCYKHKCPASLEKVAQIQRFCNELEVTPAVKEEIEFHLASLQKHISAAHNGQPQADEGRYLSEDYFFCQRWLDLGGEIFAHCNVILKHQGQVIYPLRTQLPEISNPKG